jgi:UDP-2,3-diacylglucosamine hydrolase
VCSSDLLHGKKLFFHHGDGLALNDAGYRVLKKILRSKISIFVYSLLHPDWTAPIAHGSSKTSRTYTGHKDFGETDGMIKFAEEKFTEGYDIVIMGHRHKPLEHRTEKGIYLNLGDWISYNSYAEFDGKKIELKEWNDPVVETKVIKKPKPTMQKRILKKKKK